MEPSKHALLPTKNDDLEPSFVNGLSNGIRLEKYCVEFAELTIHETELIEQVYKFCMSC